MGWFFNRDNNNSSQSSQSGQNPNSSGFFQTKSSYYSKKRHCENDPEDNQFIICKTVIKDNNGTRQKEERIPKNAYNNSKVNESQSFSFSSNFKDPFRNGRQDDEKAFDKFNSFFIQPSFYDLHNSALPRAPQDQQIQSYSSSFSQSKSCHTDPQDPQYLICKSKLYDGKETKQVEERVKVSDQFMIPSFRGELDSFGNQIDKQIHSLMRDINKGFNFMMPFIGPFMGFIDELQKLDQQGIPFNGHSRGYQKNMKKFDQDEQISDYVGSSNRNKKDTNVYDL